jgi:hypothetical protein
MLNEAADRFEAGVAHIDELAAEVRASQVSTRRLKVLVAGLALVMVVLGGFIFYTVHRFNDTRTEACRNRNGSALVTRMFAETQFAIFESATQAGDPTARQLALLEDLRDAVPKAADGEFDCNGDGERSAADYPTR